MFTVVTTHHKRLIGFILVIAIIALIPLFIDSPYYLDVFIRIIVNALLAMCFVMVLKTGLTNLSMASFWGAGAYISTVLVMKLHLSVWLAMPASAFLTGLIAVGIGFVIISSGWLGFIVLTAVVGMLFSVVVGNIAYVGGYSGIANIPAPEPIHIPFLPAIVFNSKIPYFYLALLLLILISLICSAFYTSSIGRAWSAIALNNRLAKSIGIDDFKYKLLAFTVSSGLLGLIGSFSAHYGRFVIPDSYVMFVNINILVYAVLGGSSYAIAGPFFGSVLMTLLPEFMQRAREFAPLIIGLILILLMLFLPEGLLGLWDKRFLGLSFVKKILKKTNLIISSTIKSKGINKK